MLRATCISLLFVGAALGANQTGVVVSGGQPVPGASVTIDCGSDRISTVTDAAGRFEAGGLPATACRYTIGMFGFEPSSREASASASPLTFDLKLQPRATLSETPAIPGAAVRSSPQTAAPLRPRETAQSNQTPEPKQTSEQQTAENNNPGGYRRRGGFGQSADGQTGPGRGGYGRGGYGRGAGGPQASNTQPSAGQRDSSNRNPQQQQANASGFQNLSLSQNGDVSPDTGDFEAGAGSGAQDQSNGSNEAFLVNGSVSTGVMPQQGDLASVGGPNAFGPGGPGGNPFGPAGNPFSPGGPNNSLPSLAAGGPGGAPDGGPGGAPGGGFGGGGRGGFAGGFGGGRGRGPGPNRQFQFGNRINRGRGQQFRGSAYYTVGNSDFNARPFAFNAPVELNGLEVPKAAYATNRFGFSVGGPFFIPKLLHTDRTFWFVNYTGNRSKTGFDQISTVPVLTPAERAGDFSALLPQSLVNPIAANLLLNLMPAPNAPGIRNNYQLIGANPSNNDNLQLRINQTLSAKDGLDLNLNYQRRDTATVQNFGFIDPTHGYGLSSALTWRRTFSRYLINSLGFSFSRNLNQTLSPFSNNPEWNLPGLSLNPIADGPPMISFVNYSTLNDGTPTSTRAQTAGVSDSLILIRGKQTMTYGVGVQRRQNNLMTNANSRGSFSFTGEVTGNDLVDFLEGLPYSSSLVRYTDDAFYLRETALNAFFTDDYRLRSNLTVNAGLRWEYFSPFTEKYNNLSNLQLTPGFAGVETVCASPVCQSQPANPGLIRPDYKLFSPRIGIAWKPWKSRSIVARAGYGVYYNGAVYATLAQRLLAQPPYAQTSQLQTSTAVPLTLENGFPLEPSETIANTFAVDPNYKPGYAQAWTASIQESFGRSYVVELFYNGTKGTDLDVWQLPNRALPGNPLTAQQRLAIPYASEFVYDSSLASSTYNAAQIRFQRRFARNASFNVFYTYAKALDDSSFLGGGPAFIPGDISAERAISPGSQRHNLRLNYMLESPIANTRSGKVATLLRGWTIAGVLTASSGTPFTALVSGDPSGTAYTGNDRAEATGLPVTGGSGYFNPAAFTVPAAGAFGNAGRDTIPGIPRWSLTGSLYRSFRIDDRRRIEFRIDTANPLNHPYITTVNTTVNSIQYGLPLAAGPTRTLTATVRLRF